MRIFAVNKHFKKEKGFIQWKIYHFIALSSNSDNGYKLKKKKYKFWKQNDMY